LSKGKRPATQATRLLRCARKHAQARDYRGALADIDQAISLAPSAALFDYRGVLLCLTGRVQDALESFTQALSLAAPEQQAEIYFHRGLLYGRERLYDQALVDLSQARQLDPAHATYREASIGVELEKERARCENPTPACP
jgi:tetratricopeptide (TPR) repeat protein